MTSYLGVDIGKTNLRVALFRPDLTLHHVWSASAANVPAGLAALREYLRTLRHHQRVRAAGLSIFGPLQVDRTQPGFGALIESSEPAWSGVNVPALLRSTCACPVFFDYDVNAGALAEAEVGAARHVRRFVYLSVGTGIGGAIFDGRLIAGHAPQLGHMFLPREPDDLEFPGTCRFHGACLQGLASGKALEARWRVPAQELPPDHPAWNLEARYLARACANLVYTASPECIVLGSSVGVAPGVAGRVNAQFPAYLNNFLEPHLRRAYAATPPVRTARLAQHSSLVGAALFARNRAGLRFL